MNEAYTGALIKLINPSRFSGAPLIIIIGALMRVYISLYRPSARGVALSGAKKRHPAVYIYKCCSSSVSSVVVRGCDRRELFYRVNMHHGQKLHPGGTRVPLHSAVVSASETKPPALDFPSRQNLRHIFIRTLELAVGFFLCTRC